MDWTKANRLKLSLYKFLAPPLFIDEIKTVIMNMNTGISQRSDGFPIEQYKTFPDLLITKLHQVCNEMYKKSLTTLTVQCLYHSNFQVWQRPPSVSKHTTYFINKS